MEKRISEIKDGNLEIIQAEEKRESKQKKKKKNKQTKKKTPMKTILLLLGRTTLEY